MKEFYKGRYMIAFYDRDDETLLHMYDNTRQIAEYLHKSPTRQDIIRISACLSMALKNGGKCNFLTGHTTYVHLIDMEEKEEDMKYVIISSTINITVFAGLSNIDLSNPSQAVGEKLKVQQTWVRQKIDIVKGEHEYPECVAEWPSVKALAEKKLLTIAGKSDTASDEQDVKKAEELEKGMKDAKRKEEAAKPKTLAEVAEIAK